jgi:vanillate O-demethylase monooxygenase subunit
MEAPRNQWYCAAFGHEIKGEPLGRILLEEAVVMYRKNDGTPVAFEDRCCHRRAPLSKGKVEGDNLRCGYHGFLYDETGKAIWAPGQDRLPTGAQVKRFPIVEKHGWVWIWMGDPAIADPAAAPSYHRYDDPSWVHYGGLIHVEANCMLVIDNVLDLSHLTFVHANTIGSPEDTNPNLVWERGANWVKGTRHARGLTPTKSLTARNIDFRFDRKQVMLFQPPAQVITDIFANEYGREYGDPQSRINRHIVIYNVLTPETDTTCHYFWAVARDYEIEDKQMTEAAFRSTSTAFAEDIAMIEAAQRIIVLNPSAPQIDVTGDAGGLQARRIVERMLTEERAGRAATE